MMVVTGGSGTLGQALQRVFPTAQFPRRDALDVQDGDSVTEYLERHRPEVLLHTAAMTDVRRAQQEYETCWDINVAGTERVVHALQRLAPDCYFIYVSTACVFNGVTGDFDEDSIPEPRNNYALTKLVGEYVAKRMKSHMIIRTNFICQGTYPYPRAFKDRFGTYLYAHDVANALPNLVNQRRQGLIHIVGDRKMSMLELARLTSPEVEPMTMADVDLPLTVDMSLRSVRISPFSITVHDDDQS